ncbi:hypothetical protein NECAME_14423 [Necator americanus]|uniref:Uncharacterized protein n=1 Tax=Necator americanus TaxID=51031 RepID=W2SMV2_NECAM|nr:hypothetical protein NECAME_14423 [Necator americanus]ETN70975.1 hypothetical protein NECAME_14423 [Necator americanus]
MRTWTKQTKIVLLNGNCCIQQRRSTIYWIYHPRAGINCWIPYIVTKEFRRNSLGTLIG